MMVAGNDSVQNPETVGTFLKTMSMRLRGANKQDLQNLGLDVQGMSDGTKSIVQQMKSMADIDIMQGTSYKSTYQILDELHSKWSDLTDAEQAAISEAVGGKRGGNVLASLMNNWADAQKALQSSLNSQGSAEREEQHYEQSVQYRIDQAKASLQQLSYNFLSSDTLRGAIGAANQILQIVNSIVSKIGSIPSIIAAISGIDLIKGLLTGTGGISEVIKSLTATKYGQESVSQNSMINNIKTLFSKNGKKYSGNTQDWQDILYQANSARNEENVSDFAEKTAKQYKESFSKKIESLVNESQPIMKETDQWLSHKGYDLEQISKQGKIVGQSFGNSIKKQTQTSLKDVGKIFKDQISHYNIDDVAEQGKIFKDQGGQYFDQIASSAQKAGGSVKSLGNVMSSIGSGILGFVQAHPILLAVTALTAAVAIIEKIKNAGAEANQKMQDTLDEYQNTKDQIQSIGDQIDSNNNKIAQIKAQGTITLTDQQDIQNLRTQNEELQRTLDLQKSIQQTKTGQVLKDTRDAYQKNFGKTQRGITQEDINKSISARQQFNLLNGYKENDDFGYTRYAGSSNLADQIADYRHYKDQYEKTKTRYNQSQRRNTSESLSQLSALQSTYNDQITNIGNSLQERLQQLETYKESYDQVDQSLWTEQDKKDYKDISSNIDIIWKTIDSTGYENHKINQVVTNFEKLGKIKLGNFKDMNEYLVDFAKNTKKGALAVSDLKDSFPQLYNSIKKAAGSSKQVQQQWLNDFVNGINSQIESGVAAVSQQKDAFSSFVTEAQNVVTQLGNVNSALSNSFSGKGMSAQIDSDTSALSGDIGSIIDAYKDVQGYDFEKLFIRTANGIQINSKELQKLQQTSQRTMDNKFVRQLKSLNEQLNEAALQGKDISGIQAQIQQIQALQAAYEGETSAYNQWLEAHNQAQAGNVYDTIQSTGLKQGDDLLKQGLVGTNQFRKLAELFSGQNLSNATTDQIVDAYNQVNKTIDGTTYTLRDFYKDGTEGATNFANSLVQIGQASKDAQGNIHFDKSLNIDDLAKRFHTSSDVILSQINKLNDMGAGITILNDAQQKKLDAAVSSFTKAKQALTQSDNGTGKYSAAINFDIGDLNTPEQIQSKINELNQLKLNLPTDDTGVQLIDSQLQALIDKLGIINGTTIQPGVNSDTVEQAEKVQKQLKQKVEFDIKHDIDPTNDQPTLNLAQQLADADEGVKQKIGEGGKDAGKIIKGMMGEGGKEAGNKLKQAAKDSSGKPASKDQNLDYQHKNTRRTYTDYGGGHSATLDQNLDQQHENTRRTVTTTMQVKDNASDKIKQIANTNFLNPLTLQIDAKDNASKTINNVNSKKLNNKNSKLSMNSSAAINSINAVNSKSLKDKHAKANVNTSAATAAINSLNGKKVNNKSFIVSAIDKASGVISSIKSGLASIMNKTVTVTTRHVSTSGTTHSGRGGRFGFRGTTLGSAFASGTLTKKEEFDLIRNDPTSKTRSSSTALVGELGAQMLVSGNKWRLIGENGAEFVRIPSGSVIFDAWQTQKLLKDGSISERGTAMLNGTSHNNGTIGGVLKSSYGSNSSRSSSSASKAASNAAASSARAAASSAKAANSSKDASDKSKETLDWIEVLIKRTEREIDILNRVSENVSETYGSRNNAISGQLNWLNTEISYQQQGAARYMQQANSVGLSQDWAAKVRNGKIDIEDITDEDLKQKISDYQNWYQKALDCQDAVYQLQQKEQDLYKTRFDNVQGQFDNAISLLTHESDLISKWIDVTQEQGHIVGQTYYTNLIKLESKHIQDLSAEYNSLNDSLKDAVNNGRIAEGTEQWYNMKKAINEVESAIVDTTKSLATYQQNLKQIEWDKDDYIQDRIDDLNTEFKFLYDIMDSNKFFDKQGQVTNTGTAAFGLDAMQYDTYMRKAELYRDQLKAIDKDLAKDPNNTTYLKRRQEIVKSYQDAVKSAKEEKDTIKDLVKTGYDKQLSSLQKIISKYEQLLDNEKSARQYADQVAEKQKTINDLQKQIMAMSGDTSQEGRATRQKTNESLEKAKKDLQDTQDDYRISEIKTTLSNLTTVFQQDIDNRLDGLDELIAAVISGVNENGANIATTIQDAADEYGVALSNNTLNILAQVTNSSGDIQGHSDKLVTDFRDGEFKNTSASILNGINGIKSIVDGMYANAQKQAEAKVQAVYSHKLAEAYKAAEDARNAAQQAQNKINAQAANNNNSKSDKDNYGVALAIINGNYGWGNAPGRYQKLQAKGYDAAKVQEIVNKLWREGLVHSSAWQGRYYGLTLNDLARYRYASGAERITSKQIAWTNEHMPEAIIRKSDGAVLTRLNTGDTVFNGMATKRLWDFGNNPEEFLKSLNLTSNNPVQNIQSVNANYEINFNLPNVTNSRDFMNELKINPQFAKMLQEVTLGKVVGHNTLKKNSINF